MATTRSFQAMLNQYLPNKLLIEEITERDYILKHVEKDDSWLGGTSIVPFRGSRASSVSFGSLTAAADIVESVKVRGELEAYVEMWGSMVFQHTDIMQHGKLSEQNLLKILPDEIEDFTMKLKEVVSVQLGSGPHFATVTDATNAATGIMVVDKIDRFEINQLCTLDDSATAAASYWVTAVNVNTSAVTLSATKGGAAADVSAYAVADAAKFYHPGVFDAGGSHNTFVSLRSALLSAANGGSTTLHGQTKTAYPFLQAVNILGSAISASNILDKLFDAYTTVRRKAKGMADTYLMSLKHLGSCMKLLQLEKGAFIAASQPKSNQYGWTEISIQSVSTGQILKLVGIQEMDDDIIPIVDFKTITFRTNGGFKKRANPETGNEFFEVRATTGYSYIVDICLFGQLEFKKPGHNAIIYGITDY
jgi:hypothetical protein